MQAWIDFSLTYWPMISLWLILLTSIYLTITYVVKRVLRQVLTYSLAYWMSVTTLFMVVLIAVNQFHQQVASDTLQMNTVLTTLAFASFIAGCGLFTYCASMYVLTRVGQTHQAKRNI
ncbi:hypothetical protein ABID56_000046 [Alkalibacillus flavidus]|uniref:Uncharacterized protein n=1 Tax=Alkalibacillus flavidus TaxID=546021 RepID=A0ABV2KQW7_9BACI